MFESNVRAIKVPKETTRHYFAHFLLIFTLMQGALFKNFVGVFFSSSTILHTFKQGVCHSFNSYPFSKHPVLDMK